MHLLKGPNLPHTEQTDLILYLRLNPVGGHQAQPQTHPHETHQPITAAAMEEDPFRRTSPTTTDAIKRLSADLEGPYARLYRAMIEEDIRLRSKEDDDGDGEDEGDDEADNPDRDEGEDEDEDREEDIDPRKRIELGRDPIEYHIYEVCAQRDGDLVRYWIYSADYIVEDGDSANIVNEEATRAEAIAHVQEACSYEDKNVEDMKEDRISLSWNSRDANGDKTIDFPEDDEVLEYLLEEEEYP